MLGLEMGVTGVMRAFRLFVKFRRGQGRRFRCAFFFGLLRLAIFRSPLGEMLFSIARIVLLQMRDPC